MPPGISHFTSTLSTLVLALGLPAAANGTAPCDTGQPGLIADAHIHHGWSFDDSQASLRGFDYFDSRNVQVLAYPMPINREAGDDLVAVVRNEIRALHALDRQSDEFRIADDAAGLQNLSGEGPVVVFLGIEYFGVVFSGQPENVDAYADMGIRSITIMDNDVDRFFGENLLTAFGRATIRRMNERAVLVDMAHLSPQQMTSVARASNKPVIVSHACARNVSGNRGCLPDEALDAIRTNGGYVFTTFNRNDLFTKDETGRDGIARFIENVVYLLGKLGSGKVGLGSDYQADGQYVPGDLDRADTYTQIRLGLGEAGLTCADIESVMSGAFLKAMTSGSVN